VLEAWQQSRDESWRAGASPPEEPTDR
jgi:hypothetical protein